MACEIGLPRTVCIPILEGHILGTAFSFFTFLAASSVYYLQYLSTVGTKSWGNATHTR